MSEEKWFTHDQGNQSSILTWTIKRTLIVESEEDGLALLIEPAEPYEPIAIRMYPELLPILRADLDKIEKVLSCRPKNDKSKEAFGKDM